MFVNCDDYICNYIITKSDNTLEKCISNECHRFVDPYSIMVQPNNCKTKFLHLSFSSYKKFRLFLNRLPWKLGDLFPSKPTNLIRELRISLDEIDFDDRPIDHNELIRLGINIDSYQLYLRNISKNNYFYELIHYDANYPQWDIIKVQFDCNSLMIFDQNPCPIKIISPSVFALRRPSLTTKLIPLLPTFQSSSSSTEQSKKENPKSLDLIIVILIPLLILLIPTIIFIFIYIRKRSSNMDLTTITARSSSSIPSISHNIDNNKNGLYSEYRANAKPYHISRLPSPHKESIYKEPQRNF